MIDFNRLVKMYYLRLSQANISSVFITMFWMNFSGILNPDDPVANFRPGVNNVSRITGFCCIYRINKIS